jgi:hypothetical protein
MNKTVPDLTGYIFQRDKSYWKILGPKRAGYRGYENYPVVKCTKYGKEFQSSTYYSADFIEKQYAEGTMTKCVLKGEALEVSTAGKASGIRKRRIQHLEADIAHQLKELNKLLEQEDAPFRYEFKELTLTRD